MALLPEGRSGERVTGDRHPPGCQSPCSRQLRNCQSRAGDHQAARTLGFVPTHGVSSALEMAHGRAGGEARIGYLLGPPYFPLEVGAG